MCFIKKDKCYNMSSSIFLFHWKYISTGTTLHSSNHFICIKIQIKSNEFYSAFSSFALHQSICTRKKTLKGEIKV